MKACTWVPGQLRNMNMGQNSRDRSANRGQEIVSYWEIAKKQDSLE
jgi:hypothetical protein